MMILEKLMCANGADVSRRQFVTATVSGVLGLAFMPLATPDARAQNAAGVRGGQKPTERPGAFVSIAKDGTTTVLCNRLDMGQGIETALAMICAEELDADWSKVKTGFGNQLPQFVDPSMGMHLTGGSNSIKNSYTQYRELGARLRGMLIAAAAAQWQVSADQVFTAHGMLSTALGSANAKTASYGDLFEAAMAQSVPEKVTLKPPAKFERIGKPTALKVGRAKSTGQQHYGVDVKLPGMLTALIAHPPVFGAKFKAFDASAAQKVKGVRAVLAVDLDRGARGVAVVADGYWPAKMGRDALQIEWDTDGVGKADSAAMLTQYRALARQKGLPVPGGKLSANTEKLAGAPRKISAEFSFPYLNHAQMEPLACTVDLKSDRCDVYTASQMPGVDVGAVSRSTGLPQGRVNMHVQMAGGGFGRRAVPSGEYVLEAVAVAKALAAAGKGVPVKVMWSREDDVKAGYYRPATVHRAEIGLDAQGNVLAWDHVIVTQSILKGSPFASMVKAGVDATAHEGMKDGYNLPINVTVHHPDVNVPVLWWRSVGATHTAFVMETLVDELAEAAGQDAVSFRMKLLGDKHPRHQAALQLAVDKSGYGKRVLGAGQHWGVAVHESFESVVAYVVSASVKDGKAVLHSVDAGVHCNLVVNPLTVEAQVQGSAVMALSTCMPGHAITFKNGLVEQSNYHDFPLVRLPDAPTVRVHIVPSSDAPKGMGEPGLPPFAPAVANALRRATGKPQRGLPFVLT